MKDLSKVIDNIANTEIKLSPLNDFGLFATKDIVKDTILCFLDGQFLNYKHVVKVLDMMHHNNNGFDIDDIEWNQINKDLLLVRFYPTKYKFINHFRIPNIRIFKNPLRVVAINHIKKGEELLLDYREEDYGDRYLLDFGRFYL